MDKGFVVLEGMVIFVMAAYAFGAIVFPIILDIIWIKERRRVRARYFALLVLYPLLQLLPGF